MGEAETRDCHARRALGWRWNDDERMLQLRGRLPAEVGAAVVAALERIADGYKPDPDTGLFEPYECRAADALGELASSYLGSQASPDRATVVVHADAEALVGGDGVVEVEGGPALCPETLRRLACDARLEWVAHASDGTTVGVGRARRHPPAWLVRQVRHRDGGCRFPACERRRWGHVHHQVHWTAGGPTDLDNMLWLCPDHHRLVHEEGWRVEGDPNAELTFLRPDGRPLATGPPPLLPDVRRRFR